MTSPPEVPVSRLRPVDVYRVAIGGMKARKMRATLSALGIAIGIASLVAVLGLSESSRSDLIDQLDALGTNLLEITPGEGFGVGDSTLPDEASVMVDRVSTVAAVSSVAALDVTVHRNDYIPDEQTSGLTVMAVDENLTTTLNVDLRHGAFVDGAAAAYPAVVLGSVAAERLGIVDLAERPAVMIDGERVEVIGVLEPFTLAADLDRAVFLNLDVARTYFDDELDVDRIFVRTEPGAVETTRDLLPAVADPENPEEVEVTRPSDVLEAQAAAETAFTSLFLGLGLVALVVGGIGIANVMVIGVIERRGEIGLRRAIGATRGQIRTQFLSESLLLGGAGGIAGVLIGVGVTVGYATTQGWRTIIPEVALVGGLGAAVAIGAIAGVYPAVRASRLSPTEALRSD